MESRDRPNPDELLAGIAQDEAKQKRGRLRIFFGMAPGVGKTYAMLAMARQRIEEGIDVLAGLVETHGRPETQTMLETIRQLPRRKIEYRGIQLEEFDLDAALEGKPELILVDELAHTNVPGSRHPKRYQDVVELLDAGIDVYSTLNVQHVSSRADIVTQITGAAIRETVPDSIIDRAELELVDLTPDQLRNRLGEGKVYLGERAAVAADHFFRPGNLTALREMALRFTAERVNRELRDFMRAQQISGPWKAAERLLVAVSPSPYSERLIRWTRRTAAALDAPWVAVHVESSRPVSDSEKIRLSRNLELARELGAEVIATTGENVVEALLRVARQNNVTQIVLGKSLGSPLLEFLQGGSLVDRVVRKSGDIDVYVVQAEAGGDRTRPAFHPRRTRPPVRDYAIATACVALLTIGCLAVKGVTGYWAISLIFLLGVLISGLFLSRGAVLLGATLSALLWNFLFIPPLYTFYIERFHDALMFFMYFVVALVVGSLTARLKRGEAAERQREQRASALYRFVRTLAVAATLEEAFVAAARNINGLLRAESTILFEPSGSVPSEPGESGLVPYPLSLAAMSEKERAVAAWTYTNGRAAGRFTNTLAEAEAIYIPIKRLKETLGVLRVALPQEASLSFGERQLLDAFADQLAAVIESDRLSQIAQHAKLSEEADRLRRTLLDCVSHELKTPLAVISAASENLREPKPPELTRQLAGEIHEGAGRLHRIINSLLDMTRVETGIVKPKREWCEVRDLVESAVRSESVALRDRDVQVTVPDGLPLVRIDFSLLEQAIAKLLGNAGTYSSPRTPVTLAADCRKGILTVSVLNQGPGLSDDARERIFDKFYRGDASGTGGIGLGLSIARGFVEAHGGTIEVGSPVAGGVEFIISVPVETMTQQEIES